jgi:hypothetical protein
MGDGGSDWNYHQQETSEMVRGPMRESFKRKIYKGKTTIKWRENHGGGGRGRGKNYFEKGEPWGGIQHDKWLGMSRWGLTCKNIFYMATFMHNCLNYAPKKCA